MPSAHQSRFAQGGGYPPPGGGGYGPMQGGYPPPGPFGGAPPGGQGPGGYGPPATGHAGYGPPAPPPPTPPVKKAAQTWLILGGVSFMTCGCLFGVIGIVFCYMAMQAADAGNLADAEHKLKWGKITTVVGFAVGLVLGIIGLFQLRELWSTVIASLGAPS